jgi:hypothetical protein
MQKRWPPDLPSTPRALSIQASSAVARLCPLSWKTVSQMFHNADFLSFPPHSLLGKHPNAKARGKMNVTLGLLAGRTQRSQGAPTVKIKHFPKPL